MAYKIRRTPTLRAEPVPADTAEPWRKDLLDAHLQGMNPARRLLEIGHGAPFRVGRGRDKAGKIIWEEVFPEPNQQVQALGLCIRNYSPVLASTSVEVKDKTEMRPHHEIEAEAVDIAVKLLAARAARGEGDGG